MYDKGVGCQSRYAVYFVDRPRRAKEPGDGSIFHLESQRRTVSRIS